MQTIDWTDREQVEALCFQNMLDGTMDLVGIDEDGEFLWQLTAAGKALCDEMLGPGWDV